MNKENLLKLIAESAYNIGFGAKKNFSTFDIVEKAPGWIGFISLVVGVLALIFPPLAEKYVGALMLIFGIASLYIGFYIPDREKYECAGIELTKCFHQLRSLYYEVKSLSDDADVDDYVFKHNEIVNLSLEISVTKQIFMSDWYAHFKFFWQQQIDWVDEQKKFKFLRDMVPLSLSVVFVVSVFVIGLIFLGCLL